MALPAMPTGRRNLITDVPGLAVGNADDVGAATGTTVVLADRPAVAAVDVRGGAPGTRETDLLDPSCVVDAVDALVLSGGSAFGLDAAAGVMGWLAERGRGFAIGSARVPLVPSAILFDLANGGDKAWTEPPYRRLGRAAVEAAGPDFRLGSAGAGLGALAGALKGGLGSASAVTPDGTTVGALVAANPVGSVIMPGSAGVFWAWPWEQAGEFGGRRPDRPVDLDDWGGCRDGLRLELGGHTTIAVIATDATLTKAEAKRLAIMAQDGLARAVRPAHTPYDGDLVFALATGRAPAPGRPEHLVRLGGLAADCLARAIARAVYEATALAGLPAWRDLFGG